ncbi:hypothetical protein MPTK1_2g03200 [Marchantia polymorpha subsp. ruderalis]|uniref:Glutathione S-transferase 3, mitochondrial n=2 Tax=Marchantia polymorpha TaxID=3197 RepID=A0A176VLC1_MARPO|nr:hypothetical protein AXG93_3661s1480 [Marchantia polymorpha subsp. ruderalis]PTQ34984.1 hypothetical protein MARPO_0075s0081 [Marchantia polymorpha]BBN00930.1 hypothetical protein Mp_2g03200 [Marchantia polymorpha subsp. ruderalis]|eukprot:PTQ34984.1 hypothetical protein MARPO_0075s0081 [Marchantia polymorpha]
MAFEISGDYGFVALICVLTLVFNMWMSVSVVKARKKYNVPYPALYAVESENKEAKMFNCVQRGHQNFLEFLPFFLANLLLGGLKHPLLAAGLGFGYIVARYFYFKGYSTGVPSNRMKLGGSHFLFYFGLVGCTVSLSISLIASR